MKIDKTMTSDKCHFISWCIGYVLANSDDENVTDKALQCMDYKHSSTTQEVEGFIKDCIKSFINC